jgi:2,3-bisphosphoglycerate-dependent phosphoglycerate mutase
MGVCEEMDKKVYVVRHCEAEGQPREARLTDKGYQQALEMAEFFSDKEIQRVVSSPFIRAIDSITPLAEQKGLILETDERLTERILSTYVLEDWMDKLKETYEDMDLRFDGGESSQEATNRGVSLVDEIINSEANEIVIVTHGNLMSLLLKNFDPEFGFEEWRTLSNPDVFLLHFQQGNVLLKHLWLMNTGER